METKTDINFKNTYLPLAEKFIQQIEGIPKENLPEPFIPVYGNLYDQSLFKIAFVGWETRDNRTLQNFYNNFKSDPIDCLFRFKEDLLMDDAGNFKFNYYGNNFGRGFWDFILRFLARFYCIHNWKELKNWRDPNIAEILQSFIWGNVDSIERFEVTAKKLGADDKVWQKIKMASSIFDSAYSLITALRPSVMIVLHWEGRKEWLTENFKQLEGPLKLTDTLWYYFIKDSSTHIFWTKHPIRMSIEKIDFDITIDQIIKTILSKQVFKSSPIGNEIKMIEESKKQFANIGVELNLDVEYFPNADSFGQADSGVYFHRPSWHCGVGFGFDKSIAKEFFYGIYSKSEIDGKLRNDITNKIGFEVQDKPTDDWPSWFWVKRYRNWDRLTYDEISNGVFKINLKNTIQEIIAKLKENKIEL